MDFDEYEKNSVREVKFTLRDTTNNALNELNSSLAAFIREFGIISGGVTASIFHSEEINDIDIFLKTEDAASTIKNYIKNTDSTQVVDINPKYLVETEVEGKLITANAITFKNKIQVITGYTVDMREKFDYIHCMPYYDFKTDKFHISKQQFDAIKNKKLVRNNKASANPVSIKRIEKFRQRGWTNE